MGSGYPESDDDIMKDVTTRLPPPNTSLPKPAPKPSPKKQYTSIKDFLLKGIETVPRDGDRFIWGPVFKDLASVLAKNHDLTTIIIENKKVLVDSMGK